MPNKVTVIDAIEDRLTPWRQQDRLRQWREQHRAACTIDSHGNLYWPHDLVECRIGPGRDS